MALAEPYILYAYTRQQPVRLLTPRQIPAFVAWDQRGHVALEWAECLTVCYRT